MVRMLGQNARIWLIFAVVSWSLPLALWVNEHFLTAKQDYADQGVDGPYAVRPIGTNNNGRPLYDKTELLKSVQPGQRFGWVSRVCLEEGVYMLANVQVVRVSDRVVVHSSVPRLITPEDRRCGEALGTLEMPADALEGDYRLERVGKVRPFSWFPLDAPLASLTYHVSAATKRRD